MTEPASIKDILGTFDLRTKEGIHINEVITPGQIEIAECIIYRKAPDGKKKIHVMAHTRYGKSMIIGACVAIRASTKKEPWTIIAPTKEQAQIIMDYAIQFSVNDPIISQLLKVDAKLLKTEQLTQRRSRDHITYLQGGEIRTFSATQTMGHGAPNQVQDESGLINDSDEAKAYRMIGDSTDNFIVKIGNPWFNNHFKKAFLDPEYYHINIDAHQGLKEGRLTQAHLDDVKTKPHYDVLYLNRFPDDEERDEYGYLPLYTHTLIENAQTETTEHMGEHNTGADPADSGSNASVIVNRSSNLAEIVHHAYGTDVLEFATDVAHKSKIGTQEANKLGVDGQGVGAGTVRKLEDAKETKRRLVRINSGAPMKDTKGLPEGIRPEDFENQRAYMAWAGAEWLKAGGKLQKHEGWKNLLHLKYKINKRGKIQIVSKDDLRKKYKVYDLGVADAFTYTFTPDKPIGVFKMPNDVGGVKPYYPDFGIS